MDLRTASNAGREFAVKVAEPWTGNRPPDRLRGPSYRSLLFDPLLKLVVQVRRLHHNMMPFGPRPDARP